MFQKDLLEGKRILVTGGGTGLGKAMATRYAELGAHLIICGRRKEPLEETASELKGKFSASVDCHTVDIRDSAAVDEFIETVFKAGPLHGLVNNAAGNFISRTEELSSRAIDSVLGIVLHGTTYVTLSCGRRWLALGLPGTVISIVTTYAWTGSAYVVPSAMAKAGVLALTRSLAVEWGGRKIRLNAIAPGPFPTPGAWERLVPSAKVGEHIIQRVPLKRVGEHSELANLASYLMSDYSGFVNGEVVTIDGGEWLKGAGEFSFLENLTDAEWQSMKPKKG